MSHVPCSCTWHCRHPGRSDCSGKAELFGELDWYKANHALADAPENSVQPVANPHIVSPVATKETNPKDAVGTKKVPMSTLSAGVLAELGVAMLEGARKYGRHNYRAVGVRGSVYYDAAMRHLQRWWDYNEDTDPDSGLSHITKAITSLVVLRDSMIKKNWTDDRPPPLPSDHLEELQKAVDLIFEKYPTSVPAYVNESEKDS